jgi:hypothetical protein
LKSLQCATYIHPALPARYAALDNSTPNAQYLGVAENISENPGRHFTSMQLTSQTRKYFYWLLWTSAALVTVGAPAMPSFGAQGTESVFNCTNPASGVGWQIKVNFQARTVGANPARITSTTISWHDPADGGNYSLDRSTGNLTVVIASSTGGYSIHDRCRPRD